MNVRDLKERLAELGTELDLLQVHYVFGGAPHYPGERV